MVELSGSWVYQYQQHPPLESSVFTNCMIAPVEHRQHESLPASMNPCRVSANLGLNGFGFSGLNDTSLMVDGNGSLHKSSPHFQAPLTENHCHGGHSFHFPARAGDKLLTCELPYAEQKKFLIFDQSGNETRLIFSSLSPRAENNLATPLGTTCPAWNLREDSYGAYHHGKVMEQAWTKTPPLCEESGENEIIDEISEMREDTEEINALLYSEDDHDDDDDDHDDDEEVSSGHSPLLPKEIGYCEKQHVDDEKENDDDEVASLERSSKRQKSLHGVHDKLCQSPTNEEINDGDFTEALNERVTPVIGSKRPRKDKIHDTLRVLESIIPGLKSKDPLVVLDEAISYLKCLRGNAKTMSLEDRDGSSCYEC